MRLLAIILLWPIYCFSQKSQQIFENDNAKFQQVRENLIKIGLPRVVPGEEVIFHKAYALVYAEAYEQAKWVAHVILPDVANGNEKRTNDFRPDNSVKTGSAEDADYFLKTPNQHHGYHNEDFGYDRGHLAPSADFRYSKSAISESYLYSNMSPQLPAFNRGKWADLEELLRQYVMRNQVQLYVVTGGILRPGLKKIEKGINKVSIPEQYFKVALDYTNKRAIGFVMPNQKCENQVMDYACNIDSIETLTGIDFFANLPDREENVLEKNIDIHQWGRIKEIDNASPLKKRNLPKDAYNTADAQHFVDKDVVVKICGKVVSTTSSSQGNIFLNLDKKFPRQIFTVFIARNKVGNFSYKPDKFLYGKTICITGKVIRYNEKASMSINSEKDVQVLY